LILVIREICTRDNYEYSPLFILISHLLSLEGIKDPLFIVLILFSQYK